MQILTPNLHAFHINQGPRRQLFLLGGTVWRNISRFKRAFQSSRDGLIFDADKIWSCKGCCCGTKTSSVRPGNTGHLTQAIVLFIQLKHIHVYIPLLQFFKEGLRSIFRQWTGLELAVFHQWGGPSSTDRAEALMEEVLGMFQGVDKIYKDVRIISILCRR